MNPWIHIWIHTTKDMFIFSYPSVISSLVVHVDREGLVHSRMTKFHHF